MEHVYIYIYTIIMYTESSTLPLIKFIGRCDSLHKVYLHENKELTDRNRTVCGDSSWNLGTSGMARKVHNCPQPVAEPKKISCP